jgi:hypothetical protein
MDVLHEKVAVDVWFVDLFLFVQVADFNDLLYLESFSGVRLEDGIDEEDELWRVSIRDRLVLPQFDGLEEFVQTHVGIFFLERRFQSAQFIGHAAKTPYIRLSVIPTAIKDLWTHVERGSYSRISFVRLRAHCP